MVARTWLATALILLPFSTLGSTLLQAEENSDTSLKSSAEQPRPLIQIDFSMDDRPAEQFGHVVVRYVLHESGDAYSVRHVYDWAHQATRHHRLDKDAVIKVMNIVKTLPKNDGDGISKEHLVIIRFTVDGNEKTIRHDRNKLPAAMKDVLEFLGGIRSELEKTIRFEAHAIGSEEGNEK